MQRMLEQRHRDDVEHSNKHSVQVLRAINAFTHTIMDLMQRENVTHGIGELDKIADLSFEDVVSDRCVCVLGLCTICVTYHAGSFRTLLLPSMLVVGLLNL